MAGTAPTPPPQPSKSAAANNVAPPQNVAADPSVPFELSVVDGVAIYKFSESSSLPQGHVSLKIAIKAFAPTVMMGKSIPASQIYLNLGQLRSIQWTLKNYNETVGQTVLDPVHQLIVQHYIAAFFTITGFHVHDTNTRVHVPGLDDLISSVERHFADSISLHRINIEQNQQVALDGLAELFPAGTPIVFDTGLSNDTLAGGLVTHSHFEEKRSLFGIEKVFKMTFGYFAVLGAHAVWCSVDLVFSGWISSQTKTISTLPYRPMSKSSVSMYQQRGLQTMSFVGPPSACKYVQYSAGGFFPHGQKRGNISGLAATGRIVIDGTRGLASGHLPSQGADEATLVLQQQAARVKRSLGEKGSGIPFLEGGVVIQDLTPTYAAYVWPSLVGYSITTKTWGHVLVSALTPIDFNHKAFDLLVLSPERKRLIQALVSYGGKVNKFQDLVAGKAGGSVFLLHGPPGVGKTLTAEAIAERLERPLYYVTMGELGTNPEDMEKRLGSVLELCAGWDALVIIDEADVFLEKRSTSDVTRNAMVCVMLRLIEYFEGILFLTTNRVLEFDPAFESRVTVALRYDHLTPEARSQVWRNLIAQLQDVKLQPDIDYEKLGKEVLNGRQIKNAVRLALALAEQDNAPLSSSLIEQTMAITSLGRLEMQEAAPF